MPNFLVSPEELKAIAIRTFNKPDSIKQCIKLRDLLEIDHSIFFTDAYMPEEIEDRLQGTQVSFEGRDDESGQPFGLFVVFDGDKPIAVMDIFYEDTNVLWWFDDNVREALIREVFDVMVKEEIRSSAGMYKRENIILEIPNVECKSN